MIWSSDAGKNACVVSKLWRRRTRTILLLPEDGISDNLSITIPNEFAQERAVWSELMTEVSGLESNLEKVAVIQRDVERLTKPDHNTTLQQLIGQIEDVVARINLMENAGFDMGSFVDEPQRAALDGKLSDSRIEIKRQSEREAAAKQRALYEAGERISMEALTLLKQERSVDERELIQRLVAFEERFVDQEMRYPNIRSALPLDLLKKVAELKTRCDLAVKKQALKAAADSLKQDAMTVLTDAESFDDKVLIDKIVMFDHRLSAKERQHVGIRAEVLEFIVKLQTLKNQAQFRLQVAELQRAVGEAMTVLKTAEVAGNDEKFVNAFSRADSCISALQRVGGEVDLHHRAVMERIEPLVAEAKQRIEEASYYSGPSMGM